MSIPIAGFPTMMILVSGAFYALFAILVVVIKYLSVILGLVFNRQRYVIEGIEIVTIDKHENGSEQRGILMGKIFNTIKRRSASAYVLCLMILIASLAFWVGSDNSFQSDSENYVVSMVTAGRYNFDIGNRQFGMGTMATIEGNVYDVYANPELYGGSISEREQQIGLQGWVFYCFANLRVPHPVAAFRLGCCLALAIVLSLICYELKKKYGLLFASIFFIVLVSSSWITNFAPNLYWVTFTWFIPMLLGLVCLNNLNKRKWLYPLFFLAVFAKAACGYEYITVVMLSSIMFLVAEWIYAVKIDKQHSKLLLRTIIMTGMMSLLGFASALLLNGYMRGDGNILNGLNAIWREDVLRRTFGNAEDFHEFFTDSLNASIIDVLIIYFREDFAGVLARRLLIASASVFVIKHIVKRKSLNKEFWLFVVSFLTCISWFVLGKSHSHIHHINFVMWYMGFIQISSFVVIKFILTCLFSVEGKAMLKEFAQKIRLEVNRDI